jgi:hypothetical protein
MSNLQRKWVSIIGGGLFGFGMTQVLVLIAASVFVQSPEGFVFAVVGLIVISTFLGSILAGVIDKDDAGIRGMQAGLIALAIYLMFELGVLLFVRFHRNLVTIDLYIILLVWIPIVVLGGIGGKIGGSLRPKHGKLK